MKAPILIIVIMSFLSINTLAQFINPIRFLDSLMLKKEKFGANDFLACVNEKFKDSTYRVETSGGITTVASEKIPIGSAEIRFKEKHFNLLEGLAAIQWHIRRATLSNYANVFVIESCKGIIYAVVIKRENGQWSYQPVDPQKLPFGAGFFNESKIQVGTKIFTKK